MFLAKSRITLIPAFCRNHVSNFLQAATSPPFKRYTLLRGFSKQIGSSLKEPLLVPNDFQQASMSSVLRD